MMSSYILSLQKNTSTTCDKARSYWTTLWYYLNWINANSPLIAQITLGHIMRPAHLEASSHTMGAIWSLQARCNVLELRFLLGLCNVIQRFIPNFAGISSPLDCNLRRTQAHVCTELLDKRARHVAYTTGEHYFTVSAHALTITGH